jgi:hypothetical protein
MTAFSVSYGRAERPELGRKPTVGFAAARRQLRPFKPRDGERPLSRDPGQQRTVGYRLEFRTPLGVGKSAMPEPAGRVCWSMGIWALGSCGG